MKTRLVFWTFLFWVSLVRAYQWAMWALVLGDSRTAWRGLAALAAQWMAAAKEWDEAHPVLPRETHGEVVMAKWLATVRRNAGLE